MGNVSNGLTIPTFVIDTTKPTMDITAKNSSKDVVYSGSITNDATITLTFTSNEATNNFTVGNISFTMVYCLILLFRIRERFIQPSLHQALIISVPFRLMETNIQIRLVIRIRQSDIFTWTQGYNKPSMNINLLQLPMEQPPMMPTITLTFTSSEATDNL